MAYLSNIEIFKEERAIFDKFKALHPESIEEFQPCRDNVQRWKYHIKQAESAQQFPVIDVADDKYARQSANYRRFETWEQMPPYMQSNYLQIADYWAGMQCYAVGSRVNGEYVERWSDKNIREMREKLSKREKMESDYDYCVDGDNLELYGFREDMRIKITLGIMADFVRHLPPGEHKIKIPMWDFSKLPPEKKQEAKELYAAQQWGKLMKMHNEYELSQNHYCCDEAPIKKWFRWAIENGKLD